MSDPQAIPSSETPKGNGDTDTVQALLAGDSSAFRALVDRHHAQMLRVAATMVSSPSVAEEVVQETWLAVLNGLTRFEGRSSLRTWIFRILSNRAKTRGKREARTRPFSSLGSAEEPQTERFDAKGMWKAPPNRWQGTPEKRLHDAQTLTEIERAISSLPDRQQSVLVMRDVQGFSSAHVCNVLELSETNQRVLLHRARTKVTAALQAYLEGKK